MIKLRIAKKDERQLIENLLQMYLHNISEYFPMDFNSETCTYDYDDISKYFDESGNYAIIFMNEEDVIGFSLVDFIDNAYVVQEMFILNNYKNKGLGEECITKVFDDFNGDWVIKSLPASPKSENFWNKTISKYTDGDFELEHIGKYNRAVFKFNNAK